VTPRSTRLSTELRVISIGTLAAHPLWNERNDVRTGHATTTLVVSAKARILVNPGLPPAALVARLSERSPIRPAEITHVFITTFALDHYRGLAAFEHATWLVHEPEQSAASAAFDDQLARARESRDRDLIATIDRHRELLARCKSAEDRIATAVDLFPLPGVSPGTCGILVARPEATIVVCGDAIATSEHLAEGKVLPTCIDVARAQDSFREAIEIADVLIPGRDNLIVNPLRPVL
jgi:glyoxylase-like metal-dependent hydrolase (beta-lactamase superfamily II)